MSKIKAVGFDFDGTLIMSEEKKAEEMAQVFKEKYSVSRGVKGYYKQLRGLTREEKIKSLFKKFIKRDPNKKELKDIKDNFSRHYERSLRTCPLFECTNIVKELKKQVKFLFLLSLEEKKDIKIVACKCGVGKYFDEILGGPKSKVDNLKHVLKKHHFKPSEVIYIGDSQSDIVATKKVNLKIVLLQRKFSYKKLREALEADFVFSSLCDLSHNLINI